MADITDKASLPFPEGTDQPQGNQQIQNLASTLDGLVTPKYANASAMNTANPSPTTGDRCFRTDLGCELVYRGSLGWRLTGETLWAEHTFSGSTASVTFSSIPDIGTHLRIVTALRCAQATFDSEAFMRFNGHSGANYNLSWYDVDATGATISDNFLSAQVNTLGAIKVCGNSYAGGARAIGEILIINYNGSGTTITWKASSYATDGGTALNGRYSGGAVSGAGTSTPLTSLEIGQAAGANFTSGSKVSVYILP